MRETMQTRLALSLPDRKTICQFLEFVAERCGKLAIVLPSGTAQEIDFDAELDVFHGIDRERLAKEDALDGPSPERD